MLDIMSPAGDVLAANVGHRDLQRYGIDTDESSEIVSALTDPDCDSVEVDPAPGRRAAAYVIGFSASWLQELGVNAWLEEHDQPTCADIAAALGTTTNAVCQALDKAKRKMQDAGTLRDFLRASLALRRLRDGQRESGGYEIEIMETTKITIEVED
jgi:hypothetical protein